MIYLLLLTVYIYSVTIDLGEVTSSNFDISYTGAYGNLTAKYSIKLNMQLIVNDQDHISSSNDNLRVCNNAPVTFKITPTVTFSNLYGIRVTDTKNIADSTCSNAIGSGSQQDIYINDFCGVVIYDTASNPKYASVAMNAIFRLKTHSYTILGSSNTGNFGQVSYTVNINQQYDLYNNIKYSIGNIGAKFYPKDYPSLSVSWCFDSNLYCYSGNNNKVQFNKQYKIIPVNDVNSLISIIVNPNPVIITAGNTDIVFNVLNNGEKEVKITGVTSNMPGVSLVSGQNLVINPSETKTITVRFSNSCNNINSGTLNIDYESTSSICGNVVKKSYQVNINCNINLPDLAPTGQNNSYSNGNLGVTLNVSNLGSGPASNIGARVRDNKTNTWVNYNYPSTLNPNQVWQIPYNVACQPGEKVSITIQVDPNNNIQESNENNNEATYNLICGSNLPDLAPTDQNNSYSNGNLGVTLNVSNLGSGPASNIGARVRDNKTNTWVNYNYPSTLNPNQVWQIPYNVACQPGEKVSITIQVDPNNNIQESDETNNNFTYNLVCGQLMCELNPNPIYMKNEVNFVNMTTLKCDNVFCTGTPTILGLPNYLSFSYTQPSLVFRLLSPELNQDIDLDITTQHNNQQYRCKLTISPYSSIDNCRKRI